MEPNYLEYSVEDLEDSLKTIEQGVYPHRTDKLKHELDSRQKTKVSYSETIEDEFELNEQFFRCPTCENKILFFSKTANKWGRKKVCPHCNSSFETTVKLKVFSIALIPMFVVHLCLCKPPVKSFGLNGMVSIGVMGGIFSVLAMRFRKLRRSNVT